MKEKTSKEKLIIIKFIKNIHIINNFKMNLLIKINILNSKKIIINFFKKSIIFIKCENVLMLI